MLRQRLIPSLLLKGGRLIKGIRFSEPLDAGLPHTTARAHSYQGADEIVLLDTEASALGRPPDLEALRKVARECAMPLTFGGGIDSVETARECMNAGIDKVCLNSTAIREPGLIDRLVHVFGSQAVVLGVDVVGGKGQRRVFAHMTGKPVDGLDIMDWIQEAVGRGVGEIRLTSVDREGARGGMDLQLLAEVMSVADVPIVLEGGAGTLAHLREAFESGASGIAVGTMLVFSDNNILKLKRFLANEGCNVRS